MVDAREAATMVEALLAGWLHGGCGGSTGTYSRVRGRLDWAISPRIAQNADTIVHCCVATQLFKVMVRD